MQLEINTSCDAIGGHRGAVQGRLAAGRALWARCRYLGGLWVLFALVLWTMTPSRTLAAEFLEPQQAFALSGAVDEAGVVTLKFTIAPGYYLYRESIQISAPFGPAPRWAEPRMPKGQVKYDDNFEKDVETFQGILTIEIPILEAPPVFLWTVRSQGCAEKGVCYPPYEHKLRVNWSRSGGGVTVVGDADTAKGGSPLGGSDRGWLSVSRQEDQASATPAGAVVTPSEPIQAVAPSPDDTMAAVLAGGRWWVIVGTFALAGVLLSLTPCVLPMVPIISSMVVGDAASRAASSAQGKRWRGFLLSAAYALGMALVYTALGVAAGLVGEGFAAVLQHPAALTIFALLLLFLALSLFGLYELRLPQALQQRLSTTSSRWGGNYWGSFTMGGLSALMVSPCVAAPLAGALLYISQTRDVVLGGAALFSLACGMSLPLLLVGGSAGALVPRAGRWMLSVQHFFGVVLLGVALWTVQSVLMPSVFLCLWGLCLVGFAIVLWVALRPVAAHCRLLQIFRWMTCGVLLVGAVLQWVVAVTGSQDVLPPWAMWQREPLRPLSARGGVSDVNGLRFRSLVTVADLEALLAQTDRPVMLDFYADWCVSCKEMERFTFTHPEVQQRLSAVTLIRVDVTAHTEEDRALLRRFKLFGPPGIIFFDAHGKEMPGVRVIGFQDADRFLSSLRRAGL